MKSDIREKLEKYSKAEIIEALELTHWLDLDRVLIQLEHIQRTRALKEHKKAMDEENAACNAYLEWQQEMLKKYGEGCTLGQLSGSELTRGASLERNWANARKKEQKLEAQVSRLLKL